MFIPHFQPPRAQRSQRIEEKSQAPNIKFQISTNFQYSKGEKIRPVQFEPLDFGLYLILYVLCG
jgi:hypothetical protein